MEVDQTALDEATALESVGDGEKAIKAYRKLIFDSPLPESEQEVKDLELSIYRLANFYAKKEQVKNLVALCKEIRPLFIHFPKVKTAKIVRTLIDLVSRIQGDKPTQLIADLCLDCINWAKAEQRTFLKHRVETRLCSIYVDMKKYESALQLLQLVLKEVKQLDDKMLLVEIHLIETRANFNCDNLPKARASLTAAKTNANAIHCPPLLQAEIDLWSGIVSMREKDPRTAFSYLYEAFEAFHANKDESTHTSKDYCYVRALSALRCQLLCRIMQDEPAGVKTIAQQKNMLNYQGHDSVQAILKIAAAYEDRSLKKLEKVLADHPVEDPVIQYHLRDLYDTFLEKNLLKILEPFSAVELSRVAELIELGVDKTTMKLSQLILDQKLAGTLDEGQGNLILFPERKLRPTCKHILETIKHESDCIDSLALLSKKIFD
ncbi:unnamed protein product [Amoebophrya sp. A120]|nr:unnamed protein product [Amoebophrya sp. A120]|eukprot:GSA120T00011351001.1